MTRQPCAVCSAPIPADRAAAAASRGRQARYCSGKHRETAKKQRWRAKAHAA